MNTPYKVLLEMGEKGESWQLVKSVSRNDDSSKEFFTYPIPIKR